MRIVFVCTTNVLGSAIAEVAARSILADLDPDRQLIQIESAGVRAQIGASVSDATKRELAHVGLQASDHRARWLSTDILERADLVLTMGAIQREAALALNPRALRTTFTLLEAMRLLQGLTAIAPVAPETDRHARAVVSVMATARRFRSVPPETDDLPDLVANDQLRSLTSEIMTSVRSVLHALVHPEFVLQPYDNAAPHDARPVAV